MALDPVQIVLDESRSRDEIEVIRSDPARRQIAFHSSLVVQHLGVDDRPDGLVHLVVRDFLEKTQCSWSFDLDFAEGGLVDDPRFGSNRVMLLSDIVKPVRNSPSQLVFGKDSFRCKPVHPLPPRFFPENTPHLFQSLVERACAHRAGRLHFLVGPAHRVVVGIDLGRPIQGIFLAGVMASEAANIKAPEIEARFSVDDPLGHHLSNAPRRRDPMGAETGGDEKVFHFGRFSHDEIPVRGEGLRPIEQRDDFGPGQGRNALDGQVGKWFKMLKIGFQQFLGEIFRDALQSPGNRIVFVSSHDEASHLLPEVDQEIGIPHRGHTPDNPLKWFGDDVLVFHRDNGDRHSDHFSDFRRPDPGGIDDDLRLDLSLIRNHLIDGTLLGRDRGDPGVRVNAGPPVPCSFGQSVGDPAWVNLAVGGKESASHDTSLRHDREKSAGLVRSEQLHR